MGKKPLLFDENLADQEKASLTNALVIENQDPSWIPGYSEKVKANDLSMSLMLSEQDKATYYRRFGAGPGKMQYEFAWLRIVSPSGGKSFNADVDRASWTRRGYRPVIVDPVEPMKFLSTLGVTDMPPAAHVEPDGTVRRLDDALFYVDTEDPRYVQHKLNEAAEKRNAESVADTQGVRSYVPVEAKREESGQMLVNP